MSDEIDEILAYAKYTDGELGSSDVMVLVRELEALRGPGFEPSRELLLKWALR
jgi:hypothetical protein